MILANQARAGECGSSRVWRHRCRPRWEYRRGHAHLRPERLCRAVHGPTEVHPTGRRGSCSALRDQCVIIRGVEQLLLSDSPVSGMVLATHEGAQQECNRPDQLWQCRYHCYSDLGFLLPIQTSPPPLTRTSALCQPSHLLSSVSTPRQECCWPGGDAVEAPPSSHRPPSCRVA